MSVEQNGLPAPTVFELFQNYPNPFNPATVIEYALPREQFVRLRMFNVLGEEVVVLVNELKPAGTHTTTFDAHNLPSGVYFYRLEAGNYVDSKKLLLVK